MIYSGRRGWRVPFDSNAFAATRRSTISSMPTRKVILEAGKSSRASGAPLGEKGSGLRMTTRN